MGKKIKYDTMISNSTLEKYFSKEDEEYITKELEEEDDKK